MFDVVRKEKTGGISARFIVCVSRLVVAERAVLGAAIAVLHTLCRNALREEVFVYQTRTLLGQTDVARLASSLRIAESVDLEYRLLRVLDVLGNEVETLLGRVGQYAVAVRVEYHLVVVVGGYGLLCGFGLCLLLVKLLCEGLCLVLCIVQRLLYCAELRLAVGSLLLCGSLLRKSLLLACLVPVQLLSNWQVEGV